jgi:hypothetical protein
MLKPLVVIALMILPMCVTVSGLINASVLQSAYTGKTGHTPDRKMGGAS